MLHKLAELGPVGSTEQSVDAVLLAVRSPHLVARPLSCHTNIFLFVECLGFSNNFVCGMSLFAAFHCLWQRLVCGKDLSLFLSLSHFFLSCLPGSLSCVGSLVCETPQKECETPQKD